MEHQTSALLLCLAHQQVNSFLPAQQLACPGDSHEVNVHNMPSESKGLLGGRLLYITADCAAGNPVKKPLLKLGMLLRAPLCKYSRPASPMLKLNSIDSPSCTCSPCSFLKGFGQLPKEPRSARAKG